MVAAEYNRNFPFLDELTKEHAPAEVSRPTFKTTVYREPTLTDQVGIFQFIQIQDHFDQVFKKACLKMFWPSNLQSEFETMILAKNGYLRGITDKAMK